MFRWPIWYKCQWRVGRGFLVLDTIPLLEPFPWEENIVVRLRISFREDRDLLHHFSGGTTFISGNQGLLRSWGYQWEGEKSLSRYIYIYIYMYIYIYIYREREEER